MFEKLWDAKETVGNKKLNERQNFPKVAVLNIWSQVHVTSHPNGSTFAVRHTSNAVVPNKSRTRKIKEQLTFRAQNVHFREKLLNLQRNLWPTAKHKAAHPERIHQFLGREMLSKGRQTRVTGNWTTI